MTRIRLRKPRRAGYERAAVATAPESQHSSVDAPRRAATNTAPEPLLSPGVIKIASLVSALTLIALIGGSSASAIPDGTPLVGVPAQQQTQVASVPNALIDSGILEPNANVDETPASDLPETPAVDLDSVVSDLPTAYTFAFDGLPQPMANQAKDLPWFVRPIPYPVGGKFGLRFHPILHYWRMHNGVDMGAACRTPVVAAAAGTVSFAGWNGGYGNLVVIDHGTVNGYRMETKYAHLSVIGVRVGQKVTVGQGIALVGTTGLSTGCHLHFEVKLNGSYVDPEQFLNGKPSPTPSIGIVDLTPPRPDTPIVAPPTPTPTTPTPTLEPSASGSPTTSPSGTPSGSTSPSESTSPSGTQTPSETTSPSETPSPTEEATVPPPSPTESLELPPVSSSAGATVAISQKAAG